jgi:hypothetical protein
VKKFFWGVVGVAVATIAILAYLWVMQNAQVVTQLRLDLAAFGAWQMTTPMQVTHLMGLSFTGGFLAALVMRVLWGMRPKTLYNYEDDVTSFS